MDAGLKRLGFAVPLRGSFTSSIHDIQGLGLTITDQNRNKVAYFYTPEAFFEQKALNPEP